MVLKTMKTENKTKTENENKLLFLLPNTLLTILKHEKGTFEYVIGQCWYMKLMSLIYINIITYDPTEKLTT